MFTSKNSAIVNEMFAIIPNKTYNIHSLPRNIPNKYYKDFLRGYIDGDGSLYFTKENNSFHLSLTSHYIDLIEDKTKKLSCKLYDCDYANVQPVSGVTANLAAFFGFAKPGEKVMALEVPSGGHISHADVSAAGIHGLKTVFHPLDKNIMNIDIDAMNKKILEEKPKIVLLKNRRHQNSAIIINII